MGISLAQCGFERGGANCAACRRQRRVREMIYARGLVAEVDFACPRGLPLEPERVVDRQIAGDVRRVAGPDEFAACDGCPHHVLREHDADACRLISDGKPCKLNERIRDGGPWPAGCRRAVDVAPQSLPTTDPAPSSGLLPPPQTGCCGDRRRASTEPARRPRTPATGAARLAGAPDPAMFGRSLAAPSTKRKLSC